MSKPMKIVVAVLIASAVSVTFVQSVGACEEPQISGRPCDG